MKTVFTFGYELMQLPVTLEGFTFTLWELFIFSVLLSIAVSFLFGIFK